MPIDPISAVGTGLSILSGVSNLIGSRAATNREHAWQEQMYGWQRRDALADWNMQNEYNSPAMQMQRLKDAKLNPNLVYGNGADAMSTGSVRGSSPPGGSGSVPRMDFSGVIPSLMASYDANLKGAQTDNVKKQSELVDLEKSLTAAKTIAEYAGAGKTFSETDLNQFELGFRQQLKDINIEQAKADVSLTKAKTSMELDENERRALLSAMDLKTGAERILNMRVDRLKAAAETETNKISRAQIMATVEELQARIANIKSDTSIKDLDAALKRQGIQPHDAIWQRKAMEIINGTTKEGYQPYVPNNFFVPFHH